MLNDLIKNGIRCRPIQAWPGEMCKSRMRSPFSADWSRTLRDLGVELRALQAKNVVLEVALEEQDFRVTDGLPKARAEAKHPGVILSFESTAGPLRIACDRFQTWQDNIRAIALGLHDLRRLDRYGIVRRGEQYAGWRALPPHENGKPSTREQAAAILAQHSGLPRDYILTSPENWKTAWRQAARVTHTDAGGQLAEYQKVMWAREFLDKNAGGSV